MVPNNFMPSQATNPYSNLMQPMMPQGMIWTKGKAEATNYPIPRGTTLPIFDSEDDVFYVKTVDVYGNTQPLRVFRYEEITQSDDQTAKAPTVSVEEFKSLKDELEELKEEIKKVNSQPVDKKPYRKEYRNNGQ